MANLIVRAVVPAEDREAFEAWYESTHLAYATQVFGAEAAFRGWHDDDPSVHLAIYRFKDIEAARSALAAEEAAEIVRRFDAAWQGRVTRTKEVFAVAQSI